MPRRQVARDPLATYNERVRLIANFLNATGLGLVGFAVLRPLTETPITVTWLSAWWGGCGLAFHILSLYILGYLRREADK